jgi:ectoine hydroxylase-related dioxygenase (phytanoyl-CoA dioxygenase family)
LNVPRFDIHFLPLVVSIQIPQVETYDYHWHQESAFYPWCPSVLSVWFPVLDASTREGGTMTVIPGSHVGGRRGEALYTDSAEFKQVEPELLPGEAESAVAVEIGLGDAVVFDANLVHASLPNRGVRPRVTGILRIINQRDLDRYQPLVRALLR